MDKEYFDVNSLIEEEFPLHQTQNLRYDLMGALTDEDLAYKLPGDNPTLGELCWEIGALEQSYIESFQTLRQDWSYQDRQPEPGLTITQLTAWYRTLDDEFEVTVSKLSEDDLQTTQIDRGNGNMVPAFVQFHIYREALMMFYARASVYLKALQKTVNDYWRLAVG